MKKTLLLGSALVIGVAGFSQNTAKKAISPKYLQKESILQNRTSSEPKPSGATSVKVAKKGGNQSTLAACTPRAGKFTTSYNCFGVGGGATTSEQNCLSYNKDLNTLIWTQRGSSTWAANATSGYMQSTTINASTLALDSFILYKDANTTHHARYPGGVLLNPTTNTGNVLSKAIAVGSGPTTDGTNWSGTAYTAKPLWSTSAVGHSAAMQGDSLFAATHTGIFGNVTSSTFIGSPSNDITAMPDGKTIYVAGGIYDPQYVNVTNANPLKKGLLVKGTLDATGTVVNWAIDSMTFAPAAKMTALGAILNGPRLAFSPDGMTGYVLFLGRLAQDYNNYSDSALTPIVYKTTDGGSTWSQKLAGYDWVCKHPEVLKNVGQLTGKTYNYGFDAYGQGADLTVDANGVLHFVCTVSQPFHTPGNIDSLGVYSYSYDYDNVNYHPIIWDFMTDGNDWSTLFVDSIISAPLSSNSSDTTNTYSPMNGSQILGVSSHITVSRSTDGTKIFYGWADSDPNVIGVNATGATYNTSPDLLIKAYDVNTNKMSDKKNVTNTGTAFYPYLSDQSYFDAGQNAWVVPAVFTVGDVILTPSPVILYDASSQADYYYTNCGTFGAADLSTVATKFTAPSTGCGTDGLGIKTNNAFASSINNYPNPFSTSTTISVTLSESKAFSVNVYNAIGTLVYSKKVNGNVGENNVTFDAGSLSSGVYYYTVNAGNQQATKKMVIQK